MKTKEEIKQLAKEEYWMFTEQYERGAFVNGYTQCQQDMADEINLLKSQLSQLKSQFPKYAIKGDYCAVCGCTEFWNDDEEE